MKNRHRLALGQIRRKTGSVQLGRGGGKANQVVHDHMDASAHVKSFEPGIVERLRQNSLPGEGRIAVHHNRQHFAFAVFPYMGLLSAGAAQGHGINRFQVAGVGDQVHADGLSIPSAILPGSSLVILHITAAQNAAGINIFKSRQDIFRGNAYRQRHQGQAPAMRTADHAGIGAQVRSGFQHCIEQRDLRSITFPGVALGPKIAGLKNLLKKIGLQEPFREPAAVHR